MCTVAEIATELACDLDRGLTSDEALLRIERHGPNELPVPAPPLRWRRFLEQFRDPLVLLLLVATVISFAVWLLEGAHGIPVEALVIVGIVVFNAILGFLQEERAERAVAALRVMTVPTATVIRDGARSRIASRDVVPGDLMLIEEGDAVAADGRLFDVTSLQVAEAALTGESEPVAKKLEPVDIDAALGDRTNMVFTGTVATFGRGRAIVTATGADTEIGRIASMLVSTPERQTPLQGEIERVGRALGVAVLVIAVVVVGSSLITSEIRTTADVVEVLLLGVSLAVAAVPEGLAAVLTVVLALGVERMAKRNAIVKKLSAVETLGSASVIGSDKTGTLTKNEMAVRAVLSASGRCELSSDGRVRPHPAVPTESPSDDVPLRAELTTLLAAAATATNAVVEEGKGGWVIHGDPTEAALIVAARSIGAPIEDRTERVGEVPFSSERKLMSVVHADPRDAEHMTVFVKGAPDVLLERCTHEVVGSAARPLTERRRAEIESSVEQMASTGLRTIGVARGSVMRDAYTEATEDLERDLAFLGVAGMNDPPRSESREATATARAAGIRVIMITGDHPATAAAIASEIGISQAGVSAAATGQELARLDDDDFLAVVRNTDVFARVSPEHKLRVVESLELDGHVVAMTGDGVNDAPALKTADIGIAMGITGTEVAKQAADVILTDDNFATIVAAVEEGRTIYSNIRKFIRYLLSSNVGEVFSVFFGVALADVIGLTAADGSFVAPLLATQILWINLLTDAAPALALGVDPASPGLMARPPRSSKDRLIDVEMWLGILVVGSAMAVGTLLTLDLGLPGGLIEGDRSLDEARTMAFTVLVLAQLFNVFNSRSDRSSAFRSGLANRAVWGAIGLSFGLQILVVYAPALHRAFGTVAIGAADWGICVSMASLVLWADEAWKLMKRGRSSLQES